MRTTLAAFAAIAAFCAGSPAAAQSYPVKPIRLIVPSSPGGGTDIVGRAVAQKLTELLKQQVVVENRPGAGTMIGYEIAAKSAPDGYTLVMGLSTLAILPAVHKTMRYDALKDFAPVSQAVSVPNVLVVHPSLPVRNVKELIALARARPREIVSGSAGVGTNPHLSLELFKTMAKVDIVHVPYKGSGPGIVGVISGEVAMLIPTLPTAMTHIKAARVRPLAVSTAKRAQSLPELPTIAEAALPGYEATQWFGVLAPAATPRPIIDRLHKEIVTGLRSEDLRQHLANQGAEIVGSSPDEFAAHLRSETEKWARVVKIAGIKPR